MRKETEIEAADCVADKVIRLSGAEYDSFSRSLMREWDFIRDNPIDAVVDEQGRHHCLLVLGEGRGDGILVNAEGGSCARYSAFVPGAAALAVADRYPYLAERTRQLVRAADFIAAQASEEWPADIKLDDPLKYSVSFHTLSEKFGVSFDPYDSMTYMFMAMLTDRPEIGLVRCNTEEFLIDAAVTPERAGPVILPAAGEKEMFYRNDDNKLCIGYLRGDFGGSGDEFHHSWFDSDAGRNTQEFKTEFQGVMDTLRLGILKDHKSSADFCYKHPDAVLRGGDKTRYGFKLETADRQYFVRCTTLRNDYFSVFAYDKAPAPERERSATENMPLDEYIERELAKWVSQSDGIGGPWREDKRYRQHRDGALYYLGGEDGQYMRIANDGLLTAGRYELARPGIEDAALVNQISKQYDNYEQAFLSASQLAGPRFTNDLLSEKPSVLDQIREARKAPPAPCKQKENRGKDGPGL
jgi:hypothetical protein